MYVTALPGGGGHLPPLLPERMPHAVYPWRWNSSAKERLTASKNFGEVAVKRLKVGLVIEGTRATHVPGVDQDIARVSLNRLLKESIANDMQAMCSKQG